MAAENDQGLVLRLTDFSETSQVVTMFTARHGLVRLMGKGTRRATKTRFSAGLDLLEMGEIGFIPPRGDAGLGTLTEWVQRNSFNGVRRELPRLYAGLYSAELVTSLTEEFDPHPGLYDAFIGLLNELAANADPVQALVEFQSHLLEAIGYAPQLEACVDCGNPSGKTAGAFFSSRAGGLICRDCEMHHYEKRSMPAELLKDGSDFAVTGQAWLDLYSYHLRNIAGREFKTAETLRSVLPKPNQTRSGGGRTG